MIHTPLQTGDIYDRDVYACSAGAGVCSSHAMQRCEGSKLIGKIVRGRAVYNSGGAFDEWGFFPDALNDDQFPTRRSFMEAKSDAENYARALETQGV